MYKYKLCLGLGCVSGVDGEEQIRLIKQSGFDGFFPDGMKMSVNIVSWQMNWG